MGKRTEYMRQHSAKRRQDPEYRLKQRDWYRNWYERNGKDPTRLQRKAEQMRQYRSDPAKRMQHEARWQVARAIAAGRLLRQPCERCNTEKSEAHHPDYYKPLEVVWLCRKCHREEHAKATGQG